MNIVVFILLISICFGAIYIVHKYYGKTEFYLLAIIYSIISFMMSFKIIDIGGISVNGSIIFECGILTILYYFINRYSNSEVKKYFITVIISTVTCILFILTTSFMIPSIYDSMSVFYNDIVTKNIAIFIFYPLSLIVTLLLGGYTFRELKMVKKGKAIKTILTIMGLMFIDTLLFIYFSYAFIIRFDTSLVIVLDNFLVRTLIVSILILFTNQILKIKKVKE